MYKELFEVILFFIVGLFFIAIFIKTFKRRKKLTNFLLDYEKSTYERESLEIYKFKQGMKKNLNNDVKLIASGEKIVGVMGLIFLLFAIYKLCNFLNKYNFIKINMKSNIWIIYIFIMTMIISIALIKFGIYKRKKIVKPSKDFNTEIEATVIDYEYQLRYRLPGFAHLVLSYIDPYDYKIHKYILKQDLRIKKYPIGSKYLIKYSTNNKCVYDKTSSNTEKRFGVYFIIVGIIILIASINYLITNIKF